METTKPFKTQSGCKVATLLGLASVALIGIGARNVAEAAYITPWYANPTLTARIGMGAKNFVPVSMSLSGSGEKLAVSCEADGSFKNLCNVIGMVILEFVVDYLGGIVPFENTYDLF